MDSTTLNKSSETLFLTIKKEWFDLIKSGIKKEEYREIKPFWNRLNKEYKIIIFQNGYHKNSPRIYIECLGIEKKNSNPDWCGGVSSFCYAIKLGNILSNN